ncbi:uncharacterized protein H6S33_011944 [Morchella sextelata]|uniref:uncharacterized protein n=1 Tax=Morchella sextelata TaxID=1174677 RepID=UPI001D04237B|nr:uncharacterized protein H6S33_011944 [Morchella sextelata]KAH0610417.1 hypothetical protein H6S33_011944 [Morchella sextelata]
MDRFKSISKSGWHPNSSSEPSYAGAAESKSSTSSSGGVTSRLTKNFKGLDQVAGWVGKGGSENDSTVNVRPVSTLRDPASFGPPPKRVTNMPITSHREDYQLNGEASSPGKRPPPVPPRLPPRDESVLPQPRDVTDMRTGSISTSAVERLSKAGISVPGFNMASDSSLAKKPPLPSVPRPSASTGLLRGAPQSVPTEGTTFAEKRAAVTTASAFYKNPASVSLTDASAALRTGRNFQQRHGDQVASGYKKAQDMGLDKKIQGYGELYASRTEIESGSSAVPRNSIPFFPPALPAKKQPSPELPSRSPVIQDVVQDLSGLGKKRPPPPPPPKKKPAPPLPIKRASTDSLPHNVTAPPPIIPRATRPSHLISCSVLQNNGLPTQVFPELPRDLDLCLEKAWFSKTPIELPPTIKSIDEKITKTFLSSVLSSAAERMGNPDHWMGQIQNWSAGTSFGICIFSHYPSLQNQPSVLPGTSLQPGDVLQFRSARWIRKDFTGRTIFEMRAGAPEDANGCKNHTAVVETVQYDPQGGIKVGVLQQNSNGVKTVVRGEYMLGTDMVEGGVRVFRAVADEWAKFEAVW